MIRMSIGRPDYVIRNHGFALFCIKIGKPIRLYNERGEKILDKTEFLYTDSEYSLHSTPRQMGEKLAAELKELDSV